MTIANRTITPGAIFKARHRGVLYSAQARSTDDPAVITFDLVGTGKNFATLSGAGREVTGHACNGWVFWTPEVEFDDLRAKREAAREQFDAHQRDVDAKPRQYTDVGTKPRGRRAKPTPAELNDEVVAEAVKAAPEAPRIVKVIKRVPNQNGAPEGMVRWHCTDCMGSFYEAAGTTPAQCPKGHPAKATDDLA